MSIVATEFDKTDCLTGTIAPSAFASDVLDESMVFVSGLPLQWALAVRRAAHSDQ